MALSVGVVSGSARSCCVVVLMSVWAMSKLCLVKKCTFRGLSQLGWCRLKSPSQIWCVLRARVLLFCALSCAKLSVDVMTLECCWSQ